MTDNKEIDEVLKLLFDTASDTRKFEIDLFWKRSLFFWGFIAAAFTGYALATKMLALALACFGLVCSVVWTLGNRGSKYWQEAWEAKVERIEDALPQFTVSANPVQPPRNSLSIQPLFRTREPPDTSKGPWLRGRRFSVSKLTIALSDFTSLVWLGLVVRSSASLGQPKVPGWRIWTYLAGWTTSPRGSSQGGGARAAVDGHHHVRAWKDVIGPPRQIASTKAEPPWREGCGAPPAPARCSSPCSRPRWRFARRG